MKIVDSLNPIPKYLQISAWLKELIQTGRYKKGEKIPSEIELSKICGVNRNTLRQAIGGLVSAGMLRKEKGIGTFVSSSMPMALKHTLNRISSFSEDLSDISMKQNTKVLKRSIEDAKGHVAKTLVLGTNNKVIVVCRLRAGNGVPLIYEESYLPCDMFRDILDMDLTGSMYKIISERFNIVLARCEQTIRAVNLKGKIAKILDLSENSAGIFMESITFDENSIPIEVLYSYYRGDKYIFEVELGRYRIKENNIVYSGEG
ncbi:MAG: GntR family transcriptional regulator [Desulfobacteraceae bacterium]|nr:GntR family transcriptional regulator [Desulfobacteraceae bacterium]